MGGGDLVVPVQRAIDFIEGRDLPEVLSATAFNLQNSFPAVTDSWSALWLVGRGSSRVKLSARSEASETRLDLPR